MDYRTESFRKKFASASILLGVRPSDIVSLKIRENVSSYSEYRDFVHVLEHEQGVPCSPVDGDLQGKGYLLSGDHDRVILVEHETGLEILYIAGSIASLISIVPMIVNGWKSFRHWHGARKHDIYCSHIEVRQLDEKGNLIENHAQDHAMLPFGSNEALVSAARHIENSLREFSDELHALVQRVDQLEIRQKETLSKSKSRAARKRIPSQKRLHSKLWLPIGLIAPVAHAMFADNAAFSRYHLKH